MEYTQAGNFYNANYPIAFTTGITPTLVMCGSASQYKDVGDYIRAAGNTKENSTNNRSISSIAVSL